MSTFALEEAERHHTALTYVRLIDAPIEVQAEKIAIHYLSHVNQAKDIFDLIEHRRAHGPSENVDAVIKHLVDAIKRDHKYVFGIELDWKESELK